MSDSAVIASPTAPAAASPKKVSKAKKGSPKAKAKANHPPTAQMVNSAIKDLKERGGSSLQAIKKYISSTYKVDAEKLAPFIKKYLKSAVTSGSLVQTKGKGASGSFKLPVAGNKGAEKKKAAAKPKSPSPKKAKPAPVPAAKKSKASPAKKAKKAASPKKAPAKPKAPKAAKPVKTAKSASPSKVKKATKPPTSPKAPKPKTAAKTQSPKKAAPKKK